MMQRVKQIMPKDRALLEIAALEREIFTDSWSTEFILVHAASPRTRIYAVLEDNVDVIGYLFLSQVMDTVELENVAVAPEFRRQGIASQLLHHALDPRRQEADIFLEVRASNAAAIALYEQFGFVRYHVREGYYDDPEEDAVLMKLERENHADTGN